MSLLFALTGIAAMIIIGNQKAGILSNTGTTDFRTMPIFAGAMLTMLSLVNGGRVIARGYRMKEQPQPQAEDGEKKHRQITRIRVILMFLLCLALAVFMKVVPFLILIFGFLFLAFLILGQKRIRVNLAVSVLGSGMIYLIFIVMLKLPL